ncbi:Ig-like domain-containing protein, partial [Nitrosomonas sp.]|uniref:Ig-like domain-containing protein n=1 Tax=Nitrosomonas sp. TaxID=42353 RepID=UPI001D43B867
ITSLEMDTPGCDVGLYRATQIPSQHPGDLEMIVDSKDWHEIMGRAVVPYADIHGVDRPDTIERADVRTSHPSLETGTPFGLLGAASIIDRETHPKDGIHFVGEYQFNLQGTDTIDYTDDDLCGVRILGIMPNRNRNVVDEIANIAGERVSILGEFPVLNRHADGSRAIDASGHPDTSFLVRMPANTPYLMQGIDCDGRTLNTDQTWQSLRPGEQKTCNGCHVHSRPARTQFDTTFAASSEYAIPRLGEGTVPLLAGKSGNSVQTRTLPGYGMRIEFTRDIKPIFDQHCIACHGGSAPAAGLALDNTGGTNTAPNSTWWCLVADKDQSCVAAENQLATGAGPAGMSFRRPQLTRYVRAFNARGSLLYWKAANQRTDNRTDTQIPDDIDFGDPHPTTITPNELATLSRWIDIGVPGGGNTELYDTQKPTLHLATADSGSVSQLRVGTVDLGSGINPGSLVVCILGASGGCSNLAGTAEPHGVTVVNLGAALSDPDTEIYARVEDMAGNVTEVYRSVDWFLNNASGNPNTGDSKAPNITIINPGSDSVVSGVIPVEVSYSDNVGVVSVDLYVNGQHYSQSTQEPFSFSLDTTVMDDGHNTLSAVALDAAGNQGSSGMTVTVNNGTTQNTTDDKTSVIGIISPTDGKVFGTITVDFNYSDTANIVSVDLYVNNQLYGRNSQAPYSFTLDTTTVTDADYVLTAFAVDADGKQYQSNNVTVSVSNNTTTTDTEKPIVTVASPYPDAEVSGMTPVEFETYDNVGIVRVDLYANDVLVGTSEHAPFSINWDTTQTVNGYGYLQAHAYDVAGNKGISFFRNINVNNSGAEADTTVDTLSPTIGIASPVSGTVSGTIPIDFNYSDNIGVVSIDLYVNGQLLGKNTQAPFTFTLDTTTVADGDYLLTAYAFDEAGNQGVSANVVLTVSNISDSADTEAPIVTVASPSPGAEVSGITRVEFETFDYVGIVRVDLYANDVYVGSSKNAPFSIDWDTKQTINGYGYLQAQAFDAAGNKGVSFYRNITVNNAPAADTTAPTINTFNLYNGMTIQSDTIINVSASDNQGISQIALIIDGNTVVLSEDDSLSYLLNVSTARKRKTQLHTISVAASDYAGNTTKQTVNVYYK